MNWNEMKSLVWTLALILFGRCYIAEPFKIPTGSMIPTLLIGDHLFVAKSAYDLRIPFTSISVFKVSEPKRGDVIVFKYPNREKDPSKDGMFYIKRLMGVPGDKITIHRGQVSINGEVLSREAIDEARAHQEASDYHFRPQYNLLFKETVPGLKDPHWVQMQVHAQASLDGLLEAYEQISGRKCIEVGKAILEADYAPDSRLLNEVCEFTVPPDEYFMMGDNRDDSSDGRAWGFVSRELFMGKALFIWLPWKSSSADFSWDYVSESDETDGGPFFRWKRFGQRIL